MKRFYTISTSILVSVLCCGCFRKIDTDRNIVLTLSESTEKTQSFNFNSAEGEITFSCSTSWNADITKILDGNSGMAEKTSEWIEVFPQSGSAGTHTINFYIATNNSREVRDAQIIISAGEGRKNISVSILQDGRPQTDPILPQI